MLIDKEILPKHIVFSLIWLMLCFTAVVPYYEQLNKVALYVLIPFSSVLTFISVSPKIPNKYFIGFGILYAWVCLSALFAFDAEVAKVELHQILGCFIFSYIIASWAKYPKAALWLYSIYIFLFLGAIYYAHTTILEGSLDSIGRVRVGDETLNANKLAYYTFYLTFALFVMGEIPLPALLHKIFRVLYWLCFPIIIGIAIATGSIQVPVLIIPFAGLLLCIRYWGTKENHKTWHRILLILILVAAFIYIVPKIVELLSESTLGSRIESGGSTEERLTLLKEAWATGLEHPLWGVGPGNFRLFSSPTLFSHNTFVELFANTGFMGMLIYIILATSFSIKCWRDREWHFLLFGLFYIAYQFFYVFYTDLWLMGFWILAMTHEDTTHTYRS